MKNTLEFKSFSEARKKGLSLEEIRKLTQKSTTELRNEVSQQLIDALYDGIKIKKGHTGKKEELDYLRALTSKGNTINWTNNKEANLIHEGDVIQIVINNGVKEIRKNGKKIGIAEGFERSEKPSTPNVTPIKSPKSTPQTSPVINPDTTSVSPSIPKSIISDGKSQDENRGHTETPIITEESYTFDAGRNALIGNNGETIDVKVNVPKEMIDQYMSNNLKAGILLDVVDIWISEANKVADSLWFGKETRNEYKIIHKNIEEISKSVDTLLSDPANFDQNYEKITNEVFSIINKTEMVKGIIGHSDIANVKNILLSDRVKNYDISKDIDGKEKDKILIEIYNHMRYIGWSGNSEDIQEKVSNHLLGQEEFVNVKNILDDKKITELISSSDKNGLLAYIKEKGLSEIFTDDVTDDIMEKYNKMESKMAKNNELYRERYDELANQAKENGEKFNISFDEFKKQINLGSTMTLLKHILLENKIDGMSDRGSEKNSYTGLYANMVGLWDGEKGYGIGDIVILADKNIDIALEVGLNLAVTAATMGIGTGVMMGARAIGTGVTRFAGARLAGTGLARLAGSGTLTGVAPLIGGIAKSSAEGVLFYEGMVVSQNLIYKGVDNWSDDTGNIKEITKSIGIVGAFKAFRGLGQVYQNLKLSDKLPLNILKDSKIPSKLLFASGIGVEAATITGISHFIENVIFDGNVEWTLEEYLQAVILVGLFKGAGKVIERINVSKDSSGKINFEKISQSGENIQKGRNTPTDVNIYNTKIETEFNKIFSREININKNITLTSGDKTITITKLDGRNKYQINGDTKIYTLKEILGKIEFPFKEAKIDSILNKNLPSSTAIDGKGFIFKNHIKGKTNEGLKYRIGNENGKIYVEYTENGASHRITGSKALEFMNKPEVKIRLLEKKIQNMTIEDVIDHFKKEPEIVQKIKSIPRTSFEIMKSNIVEIIKTFAGFGVTGIGLDLLAGGVEGETINEALLGLLKSFAMGGVGGTGGLIAFKLVGQGYKILKFSGGKVKELTGKVLNSAWNNKGKVLTTGTLLGASYGIYKIGTKENIDEENTD